MSKSRRLAYIALTITAVIWGAAFPIVKPAFDHISPMQFLYLRFLSAGVCSLPIFIWYYIKLKPKLSYILKVLLIESFGIALPLLLLYEGLSRTTALEASLIGATGPVFVVLGGILFLRERESRREWQGLGLALLGSLILVAEPLLLGRHTETLTSTYGNLLIMAYNLVYAVYAIIAKKYYSDKPPLYFGSLPYFVAALIYGLILSSEQKLPNLTHSLTNLSVAIPVLYMAVPGGILAFALYLFAQSKIEVGEANLFTYLNGVVAIPAAYLLLGEKPSPMTLFAILIVALGVYRAEFKTHS